MTDVYVGNDVVDLGQPRTEGRSADERFVARVYDEGEQAQIRAAADPDLEVWTRWAAKEAGFKVITKLIGAPPAFVHRAFKVRWAETMEPKGSAVGEVVRRGHVSYQDFEAEVSVELHPGSVHAVGFGSTGDRPRCVTLHPRIALLDAAGEAWAGPLDELRSRFTPHELDAVYSRQSAAVRLGARADLARTMQVEEGRVEIVCDPGPISQRPPRVVLDGRRARADVSLSHDGRWLAWVLWLDTESEQT